MMTVNEVSKLTGVSIRTLQYYDKIGLLRPAQYTDAGYRLYDDAALETLQQILLFRELEFPLKDIGEIIAKRTKQDIADVTQDIAAEHHVRIYVIGSNRIKLDYDETAGCWEYKVDVYMTIDYSNRHLTVEGLLHASGNTSMMRVYDACNGTEVWALFDGKGTADENRQVEYKAIA